MILLNSEFAEAEFVLNAVKMQQISYGSSSANLINLVFFPHVDELIKDLIEEEGFSDLVKTFDFQWQMIPLDSDLLSLELPNITKTCLIEKDSSLLKSITKTLMDFQLLYGNFASTIAIGKNSMSIVRQMGVFEKHTIQQESRSGLANLYIFDRDMDFASLLLSPVTYESLLDEVFEVNLGKMTISDPETKTDINIQLTNNDKIFQSIRYKHFASIFPILSESAKKVEWPDSEIFLTASMYQKEIFKKILSEISLNLVTLRKDSSPAKFRRSNEYSRYEELCSTQSSRSTKTIEIDIRPHQSQ